MYYKLCKGKGKFVPVLN